MVAPEYYLNYNEDSLAFVVISAPMMFENAFLPFLANVLNPAVFESNNKYFDPIDECMQHYFNILQKVYLFFFQIIYLLTDWFHRN